MKKTVEKFDILKLLGGFNLLSGPVVGKLIHQVIVILVVLGILAGIWYKMFYQRTQLQKAEEITNITEVAEDRGFRLFEVKVGFFKFSI